MSPERRHEHLRHLHQAEQAQLSGSMSGSQSGIPNGWSERLGAQDEEDINAAWNDAVTKGDSVLYLALTNKDYDHMHHIVYVGNTRTGEPLFAGIFLYWHAIDYIRFYSSRGLLIKGFEQRDVMIFPDPLGLYAELTVFTIKDFSLPEGYVPVMPAMFPLEDVGRELVMSQYGVHVDDPDTLFDLPLRQRSNCQIIDALGWGNVGIGRHNCAPIPGAHSSYGAPIFDAITGELLGFYGGSTGFVA